MLKNGGFTYINDKMAAVKTSREVGRRRVCRSDPEVEIEDDGHTSAKRHWSRTFGGLLLCGCCTKFAQNTVGQPPARRTTWFPCWTTFGRIFARRKLVPREAPSGKHSSVALKPGLVKSVWSSRLGCRVPCGSYVMDFSS